MEQLLESNVPQLGNMVLVLAGFALTTVLLAALGIYGVVAYAAARRWRLLESQLWDVSPTDPSTFAGMVVLVAAAACFVPTRRAVTLNPTLALRE